MSELRIPALPVIGLALALLLLMNKNFDGWIQHDVQSEAHVGFSSYYGSIQVPQTTTAWNSTTQALLVSFILLLFLCSISILTSIYLPLIISFVRSISHFLLSFFISFLIHIFMVLKRKKERNHRSWIIGTRQIKPGQARPDNKKKKTKERKGKGKTKIKTKWDWTGRFTVDCLLLLFIVYFYCSSCVLFPLLVFQLVCFLDILLCFRSWFLLFSD